MNPRPTHHPADETLLRLAAGTLPSGLSLVIATHLPFCPTCQAAVRLGETIGGALLSTLPPSDLMADALTRTLARLDMPASGGGVEEDRVMLGAGVALPDALRGLVRPKWRWMAPGISRISVNVMPADSRQHVYLLRVAPGTSLPGHGHHGWEATCVLSGSFQDITGEYGPGDVAETDLSVMHEPVAGRGEACICLIAWEGRLRMSSPIARLMQPLFGV